MGCALIHKKRSAHTREDIREGSRILIPSLRLKALIKFHIKAYKLEVIVEASPSQESSLLI